MVAVACRLQSARAKNGCVCTCYICEGNRFLVYSPRMPQVKAADKILNNKERAPSPLGSQAKLMASLARASCLLIAKSVMLSVRTTANSMAEAVYQFFRRTTLAGCWE